MNINFTFHFYMPPMPLSPFCIKLNIDIFLLSQNISKIYLIYLYTLYIIDNIFILILVKELLDLDKIWRCDRILNIEWFY